VAAHSEPGHVRTRFETAAMAVAQHANGSSGEATKESQCVGAGAVPLTRKAAPRHRGARPVPRPRPVVPPGRSAGPDKHAASILPMSAAATAAADVAVVHVAPPACLEGCADASVQATNQHPLTLKAGMGFDRPLVVKGDLAEWHVEADHELMVGDGGVSPGIGRM